MLLHWGGEYLLKNLTPDLQARIKEPRVDPNYDWDAPVPHLNGKTGEILKRVPAPVITRVSRRKLRKFLAPGLDIQCGKRLASVRLMGAEKVIASFEDGSEEIGNLIVGGLGGGVGVGELVVVGREW